MCDYASRPEREKVIKKKSQKDPAGGEEFIGFLAIFCLEHPVLCRPDPILIPCLSKPA
jgi:hypothetical protein